MVDMANKRKKCGNNHRFQEHCIGAGLTRKTCILCGELQIGEKRRSVLALDQQEDTSKAVFAETS